MKESTLACYELERYQQDHPDAPDSDPVVVKLREMIGIPTQSQRPKPPIDDDSIVALWNEGMTLSKIAKELGYSLTVVSDHARRQGIRTKADEYKHLDEEILKLHKLGLTRLAIAERLGSTGTTISAHYEKLGLKPNKRARGDIPRTKISKLVSQGLTMQKMTVRLGADRKKVKNAILTNGLWTHYNEIQDQQHHYVFLMPDGGYRDYDTMKELERQEDVSQGEVMTLFEYSRRKGVKF